MSLNTIYLTEIKYIFLISVTKITEAYENQSQ